MSNNYLKRGKGKNICDVRKYDFFSHYRKNTKSVQKLDRKTYSAFIKNLLSMYAETIVREALEVKFGKLGTIRVQSKPLNFLTKDGKLAKSLKVNWVETWEYWKTLHPNLTEDEIVAIKNKKVIYFENEHTNGEFYSHLWDNATSPVKYKRFYKFKPSRQYSRLIKKVVTAPNRKVFYYG
jgi:hypothetical protein